MKVLDLENLSIEQTKSFNSLVPIVKAKVNEICASLLNQHQKELSFLFSPIVSRNPLVHPFYLQMLKLEYLLNHYDEFDVVMTNDVTFFRCCKKNGLTKVKLVNGLKNSINYCFLPFKHLLQSFYNIILNKKLSRIFQTHRLPQKINLIDCFFLPKDLTSKEFKNSYFTGIGKSFDSITAEKTFYLVSFAGFAFSLKRLFARQPEIIFDSEFRIICKEMYFKFSHYLSLFSFFKKTRFSQSTYRSINIHDLIESSNHYRFHPQCVEACLNWIFIKEFVASQHISKFYTWFENQVLTKAYTHSLYTHSPGTLTYGYQGLIYSDKLFIGQQPLAEEINSHLIPSEIMLIGLGGEDRLREFAPTINYSFRATLRYQYLMSSPAPVSKEVGLIAVTLPYYEMESLYIIRFLTPLAKMNKGISFFFKFHPASNRASLESAIFAAGTENFSIADESTTSLILRSCIQVSSASGTSLESVCLGTPAAIIGIPNQILQNTIPCNVSQELWAECWTVKDLSELIEKFSHMPEKKWHQLRSLSEDVRKKTFYS